jgi:hypothetical protein
MRFIGALVGELVLWNKADILLDEPTPATTQASLSSPDDGDYGGDYGDYGDYGDDEAGPSRSRHGSTPPTGDDVHTAQGGTVAVPASTAPTSGTEKEQQQVPPAPTTSGTEKEKQQVPPAPSTSDTEKEKQQDPPAPTTTGTDKEKQQDPPAPTTTGTDKEKQQVPPVPTTTGTEKEKQQVPPAQPQPSQKEEYQRRLTSYKLAKAHPSDCTSERYATFASIVKVVHICYS